MSNTNPFADLDEPVLVATGEPSKGKAGAYAAAYQQEHDNAVVYGRVERKTHEEVCPKCRGSKVFRSYTGRIVGPCHKCKGQGVLLFSTTQVERQQAKVQREARKVRTEAEHIQAFQAAHGDVWNYLDSRMAKGGDDFVKSCIQAVIKYGSLSEGRMAACLRGIAKREERKVADAVRLEAAPTVDASGIKTVLDRAHARGLQHPALRFTDFTFQRAGDESRNPGCVYVVGEGKLYLGKITPEGKLVLRREGEQHQGAILAIAANPEAAADLHGQETGTCSCCGRALTKAESVQRGIGPICYAKYFG